MSRILGLLMALIAAMPVGAAAQEHGGPGDYGYRHEEYHRRGIIDELRRKTGATCCDGMGECRATYVNVKQETALLDGRWCPLNAAPIRRDIQLPDHFSLVCAGPSAPPFFPCPIVYCVAVGPGY
jgi:hypothetical protein